MHFFFLKYYMKLLDLIHRYKPQTPALLKKFYGECWRHRRGFLLGLTVFIIFSCIISLNDPGTWISGSAPDFLPDLMYYLILMFLGESISGIADNPPFFFKSMSLIAVAFSVSAVIQYIFHFYTKINRWFCVSFLYHRHVIIAGLSRKGAHYAKKCAEKGLDVIVIEKDQNNVEIENLRCEGVRVHTGDATELSVLRRAGAWRAKEIFCFCLDDQNFEVANSLQILMKKNLKMNLTTPKCYIHIWDRHLFEEIYSSTGYHSYLSSNSTSQDSAETKPKSKNIFKPRYISLPVFAAKKLLDWEPEIRTPKGELIPVPKLFSKTGKPNHYLIIGAGATGQEFIIQTMRKWVIESGKNASLQKPVFYLIDKEAEIRKQEIEVENPVLFEMNKENRESNIIPFSVSIPHPEFTTLSYFSKEQIEPRRVIIALRSDFESVTAGLSVLRFFHQIGCWKKALIVVQITEEKGVMWCDTLYKNNSASFQLQLFNQLEEVLTLDFKLNAPVDEIAQILHSYYLDTVEKENIERKLRGQNEFTTKEKPASVPWYQLDKKYRESTRMQAASMKQALASLDSPMEIVMAEGKGDSLTRPEIEFLAKNEHIRWMKEQERNGISYASGDRTDTTHPDMLPWRDDDKEDGISEGTKDYDRNMIKGWKEALEDNGLMMRRIKIESNQ